MTLCLTAGPALTLSPLTPALVQRPALPAPLAHQEDPEPLLAAVPAAHRAAAPVTPGGPEAEEAGGEAGGGGAGGLETSPVLQSSTRLPEITGRDKDRWEK